MKTYLSKLLAAALACTLAGCGLTPVETFIADEVICQLTHKAGAPDCRYLKTEKKDDKA